jgi:branched-chain amino acid transport system substrate-binding protein
MRRRMVIGGLCAIAAVKAGRADDVPPVRIGVLTDRTALGAALSGPATVAAAQLAVNDFGLLPNNQTVEIVSDEFHLRADEALAIARHWFDQERVSAIVDIPTSVAAIALRDYARANKRTVLNTSSVNPALTAVNCAPTVTHWADDTYTRTMAVARGFAAENVRTWYLAVPDMPLGLAVQADAIKAIEASGGRIAGQTVYPAGMPDFSPAIEKIKASGAQAIGLCDIDAGLTGLISQGRKAGMFAGERRIAAFMVTLSDMQRLDDGAGAGLFMASSFYWNMSEQSRGFAGRFKALTGRMPEQSHAATYAAVRHYLHSLVVAASPSAEDINLEMRKLPLYFFGKTVRVREDGRVLFDVTLYRARKSPDPTAWFDCFETARNLRSPDVYRPGNGQPCLAAF